MRRKAQGAIEYLFMIAAALIIILIVVRQLQGRTSTATETIQNTSGALESNLTNLSGSA
ncbi:class III signal peptide-containing protein [Thermococcus sp. M36]|uniref:class III signal peptide-containing protein n=1 Tax=Thermococcus sp. M36 TaxID=1638261 RepID=UPI00143A6933|nr:class III signal peptide-containing protein [Thermococcus sp. M36]NJE06191.1 class III signal peptide-containing protein [Thermococcus sp. M36]